MPQEIFMVKCDFMDIIFRTDGKRVKMVVQSSLEKAILAIIIRKGHF